VRPLELAIAALVVVWVAVGADRITPRWTIAAAAAVLVLATIAFGPWRWQLWPLGVAVLLIVPLSLLPVIVEGFTVPATRLIAIAAVLLTVLSALLAWVLPIPRFDLEEGSQGVGTVAFDLTDPDRASASTTVPATQPRGITVQAWFPSTDGGSRLRATEAGPGFGDAVGGFLGLPGFALRHLDEVRTGAIVGAKPSSDTPLPVIVSLHGWGGFRLAQAPLLEQLAADGHLVLSIDHTHGSIASQPVSGGVIPLDPQLLPNNPPSQAAYDAASTTLERMFADDAQLLVDALRDASSQVPAEVLALADLDRMIVLGHSTGGGAALWFCAEDAGCRGVVAYDAWVEPLPPAVRASGPGIPWLEIGSGEWQRNANHTLIDGMVASLDDVTAVTIEGTLHRDFTVQPALSPLSKLLGLRGELEWDRTQAITLELTRAFIAGQLGSGPGDPMLLDNLDLPELARG
jgi:pimeloyl-ACP methyl ester carboxylesterase